MSRVVVVGGGIIGLSLAYELGRRGRPVRLLDRQRPGREASWAGAGILTPANMEGARSPIDRLRALSLDRLRSWAEELREETHVDTGLRRCGSLRLAMTSEEAAALEEEARDWRGQGVEIEEARSEDLQRIAPALGPGVVLAFHLPGEMQIRNPRHLRALTAALARRGVRVEGARPVTGFRCRGGRVEAALTPQGPVEGDAFVVACGAWSPPLLRDLGVELPGEPVRGQIVLLDAAVPPLDPLLWWGSRYVVPRPDGRVLVGSTQERAGFDASPTAAGVRELLEAAARLVPALSDARFEGAWAGLRPGTHDGQPYIDAAPGQDNLWVATGHLRAGLELSAGTAVVLADLLEGSEPPVPLHPFRLGRA